MKSKLGLSALGVVLGISGSQAAQGPNPNGVWMRDDGNAKVRIARCGEAICATNLWIRDTSGGEEVGDRLVMSLSPRSPTTLAGKAYDPKRKMSYSVTVTVEGERLVTRGCILGGVVCKNVYWTPAQ
jgi:uncharacterized protein (DUF2147 family)